jgi:hypothetical protein
MQKHSRTVDQSPFNAEILWGMDPQSIDAVTKACNAWFSQANRVRDEAVRFAQDRFAKELEAAVQLARCTNPTEAFTLQAEFASKMAADYLAEGQKMVELMGEIAKEATSSPTTNKAHH